VVLVGVPLLVGRRRGASPAELDEGAAFSTFVAACHRGRPGEVYAALLGWLDAARPDWPEPRLAHWMAEAGDPQLLAAISALESTLFAQDRPAWPTGAAMELARKVREHRLGSAPGAPRGEPSALAPLNP
jgi:hypothetical protein